MEDSLFIIRQKSNLLSISERKTCYNIFNEFKNDIISGLPKANLYFKKVAKALFNIGIVIVNSDKNLGLVLIDKETLIAKEETALQNGPYLFIKDFSSQSADQNSFLMEVYSSFINEIKSFSIKDKVKSNIPLKTLRFPKFYGMPKIHKDPWTIRSIFAAHSWMTTKLSAYLHSVFHEWLTTFQEQNRSHIVNSTKDFLLQWEKFAPTNADFSFADGNTEIYCVTADVEELYTNLKHNLIMEAVNYFGSYLKIDNAQLDLILKSTQVLFNYAFFTHGSKVYKQTEGIPMGTNAGPTLANLTLLYFGFFSSVQPKFLLCRFIDDILFAIRAPEAQATRTWSNIASRLFPQRSGLSLKITGQGHQVNFLDVEINTRKGQLSLYRKPMFSFNYVSARSKHPAHALKSWIKNEYYRIMLICNNPMDYYKSAQNFRYKLSHLHYEYWLTTIPAFSLLERKCLLTRASFKRSQQRSLKWIQWPYEGRGLLRCLLERVKTGFTYRRHLDFRNYREATTLNSNLLKECQYD
jgi:hypothetical protein